MNQFLFLSIFFRTVFLFSIFFISTASFAFTVSIQGRQILFQAPSCASILEETASIWSRVGPMPKCICHLESSVAKKCSIDVSDSLPRKVAALVHLHESKISGPNCWNSVLSVNGMASALYESNEEVEFWFNSPLCRPVLKGEERAGDILNFTRNGVSDHSNRLISAHLVFNKDNPAREAPYEIVDYLTFLKQYGSELPGGRLEYSIYRCENFTDYHLLHVTEDIELINAERTFELNSKPLTELSFGKIKAIKNSKALMLSLGALIIRAEEKLKLPKIDAVDDRLIERLSHDFLNPKYPVSHALKAQLLQDYLTKYSLLSEQSMHNSSLNETEKSFVQFLRSANFYHFKVTADFIRWARILMSSRNMRTQLESLHVK